MNVLSRTENRVRLSDGTSMAVIRRDLNGTKKDWLLTAFEKDGRRGEGRTVSPADADPARSPDPSAEANMAPKQGNVDVPARELAPDEMARLTLKRESGDVSNLFRCRAGQVQSRMTGEGVAGYARRWCSAA